MRKIKCIAHLPQEWHMPQQLQTDTKRTFATFWRFWKYWLDRFSKSGFHLWPSSINQRTSGGLLSRCRHWCQGWAVEIAIFAIWCCQGVQRWVQRMPLWLIAGMTGCWCFSFLQEPIPWHHLKSIKSSMICKSKSLC